MSEPQTAKLQSWVVVISLTIAVVATGACAFYGFLPVLACATCLAMGWIAGALLVHEAARTRSAAQVLALTKELIHRSESLRASLALIAELEEESANRLAQAENAAALAEAHLAELNRLRGVMANG